MTYGSTLSLVTLLNSVRWTPCLYFSDINLLNFGMCLNLMSWVRQVHNAAQRLRLL